MAYDKRYDNRNNNNNRSNNDYNNRNINGGYQNDKRNEGLPDWYLKDGYFEEVIDEITKEKVKKLKDCYILNDTEKISKVISMARPSLKSTQLRKFYDYAVNIKEKMRLLNNNFSVVTTDIEKLVEFAYDAKNKGKVPEIFFDFIKMNVLAVKTREDFVKGFMEHFQAVVAYYPKNN
jgi:CRISPR-associated protein Csm2